MKREGAASQLSRAARAKGRRRRGGEKACAQGAVSFLEAAGRLPRAGPCRALRAGLKTLVFIPQRVAFSTPLHQLCDGE